MIITKFKNAYRGNAGSTKRNFTFTTDSGIVYSIYTLSGYHIVPKFNFSNHLIYLGFRPIGEDINNYKVIKNMHDEKIMNTVFNFIIDLLEHNKNNIIVFTYSDEEGKRESRIKLFNMLHIRHGMDKLHKMDFIFPVVAKVSILFRKDNDYCSTITTITHEDILNNTRLTYRRR